MLKRFKLLVAAFAIAIFGATAFVAVPSVGAVDAIGDACTKSNSADNPLCKNSGDEDAGKLIGILINTLLFIVGSLAVVMIIWAGITYVISAGDSAKVKRAKDTRCFMRLSVFWLPSWPTLLLTGYSSFLSSYTA